MNGSQGINAFARTVQDAADQIHLTGQEGSIHAVGQYPVPILKGMKRSNGGLQILVHDLEYIHLGLLIEGNVRLHSGFATGDLLGKVKREERGNVIHGFALNGGQHSFAPVHL